MTVTQKRVNLYCHHLEKEVNVLKIHLNKQSTLTAAHGSYLDKDIFKCQETDQCSNSNCCHVKDGGIDYLQN